MLGKVKSVGQFIQMFTPLHRLPGFDALAAHESRRRWSTPQGHRDAERITELIRQGAGEDFLQRAFQRGDLPTLTDEWDLRGFLLIDAQVHGQRALFEAIAFNYARIHSSQFDGVGFDSVSFAFATTALRAS